MSRHPDDPDPEHDEPDSDEPGQALIVRPETRPQVATSTPAPKMELAASLNTARPRTFVHIDGKGQVRSPARYKALMAVTYGTAGALIAGVGVVYTLALGLPGALFGLGLGAWFTFAIRRQLRLNEAVRLLVHDRLDEAEAILRSLSKGFRVPRRLKALIEQNLGAIAVRRRDYETALGHQRAALKLYSRLGRSPLGASVSYGEVVTLVNLDRVGEARQRLEQHKSVPKGDFLRLLHWAADLYVSLAEGEHRLSDDELHERSRAALGMTSGAALLGLCAWAQHHAQKQAKDPDLDQAWHLLRESYDRRSGAALPRALPKLWTWMESHRKDAEVPPDDDNDEDGANNTD